MSVEDVTLTGEVGAGESVLAAARRVLGGSGYAGHDPWAVDLTADPVRLAAGDEVTLAYRPMTTADLGDLVRWQRAPHAVRWFRGESLDPATAGERYGPQLRGEAPTRMWVLEVAGRSVGYLQDYRVCDHDEYAAKVGDPEAVAFDYLIGDQSLVGGGLGTRVVWTFCRDVLRRDYPDAPRFVASPDHRNAISLRVLAKCGFTEGLWIDVPGQDHPEVVCTLDVARVLGRVTRG
ncbi:MAG: GNAT family N-acetyltransferase [Propionibacteriales bacterium]|nr:GNAT family N-acetyltransferase [Propionibacteriales bacterium]